MPISCQQMIIILQFYFFLLIDRKSCTVVEVSWQQPPAAQAPSFPTPTPNIPRLLDLHIGGPPLGMVTNVSLPPPSVTMPGLLPIPLQPQSNPLPQSSGVMQPRPGASVTGGILPASNVPGIRAPLLPTPPHPVTSQPPQFAPFPDMSLISSVPPPSLGHMNLSEVAATKDPLVPFLPPAVSHDYVSQSEYYSSFPEQAYRLVAESITAFPKSVSSGNGHVGVGATAAFGDSAGESKPQMTKTARDREARAKKKMRKQAMEPLSVESFLGVTMSRLGTQNSEVVVDTVDDVKQKPEIQTVADAKVETSFSEESNRKEEDTSASVIVIDDPVVSVGEMQDGSVAVETKQYHFDWNATDDDESDVSVSSVHTSDLSSFEDDAEQTALTDAEAETTVYDSSPIKSSQVDKAGNESG